MQTEVNPTATPPRKGRKYTTIVTLLIVFLIAMAAVPLAYEKTGYELLHALQRYTRRKSKLEHYSVPDTIQTFQKFLEIELEVEKHIRLMEDSARQVNSLEQYKRSRQSDSGQR